MHKYNVAMENPRLDGTQWKLVTLAGAAVATKPSVTLRFGTDGTIHGSDGCNAYRGLFSSEGDALSLQLGASTMKACPEPIMTQAHRFAQALSQTRRFIASSDELALLDERGEPIAAFAPLPIPSLTGTAWVAYGVNNGRGAVVSSRATPYVSAIFRDDGIVIGSAGCNAFRATYRLDGDAIAFSDLVMTGAECPDDDLARLDSETLSALGRSARYRLDEDRLELRDDGGALQIGFHPLA